MLRLRNRLSDCDGLRVFLLHKGLHIETQVGFSGSLRETFDGGTCAAWLRDLLKPHVTKLLVCDQRKNALLKSGIKIDRIDARKLADLLRTGASGPIGKAWFPITRASSTGRCNNGLTDDPTIFLL